ncbi:UBA domain-containing protein, partial [Lachnellula suecica]
MAGALSKRQQARNERTLQELIKSVPGNNVCADCQARNPGWASWSVSGYIFVHAVRRLASETGDPYHESQVAEHGFLVQRPSRGTYSTFTYSGINSDKWQNMKRVGNVASNRIYNPQNTRPPIPFDADEADSAMERFIRQKYQDRTTKAAIRHNTGSTNSDDQPPPLPPKTGSRFGFRSASSIFPLSSKARRESAARQQEFEPSRERSPSPRRHKPARVFGSNVGTGSDDDLEAKMAKLREMGFMDEKRNMAVLKGLSGNLEKSIETLARLGEGNGVARISKSAAESAGWGDSSGHADSSGPSSRSRTPISPAGLTINRTREKELPKQSSNPFDMLDNPPPIAQPQSSQSTGSLPQQPNQMTGKNPYQQTSNPFGLMPSQSQVNLNQAFQNMAVAPSQPLFPNHTGGFPGPQQSQHQQLYQQSMTPPVPSIPQQYYPPVIYENPQQQQVQQVQPNSSYNPFMQNQQT